MRRGRGGTKDGGDFSPFVIFVISISVLVLVSSVAISCYRYYSERENELLMGDGAEGRAAANYVNKQAASAVHPESYGSMSQQVYLAPPLRTIPIASVPPPGKKCYSL